jgi:hypothetical protein
MDTKQPKIADRKKQEILETAKVLDVVSQFLELKMVGNEFRGYSPVNNERTPSFYVNPGKGIFKDFSSGKGGNVVTFLMEVEGFTYPEALAWLADFYDIDLDQGSGIDKRSFRQAHKPKQPKQPKQAKEPAVIPYDIARKSFLPGKPFSKRIENNTFLRYLAEQFGQDPAERLADYYLIGTTKKFNGSPIFWQVDEQGRFRYGNVIGYHSNGKRVRGQAMAFHALSGTGLNNDFKNNYKRCLFGEHLIKDRPGPFGIVESEKTAIVASIYLPGFTWLATAGQHNIKAELLKPLQGKPIVLYPDLDATEQWQATANQLSDRFNITCSTFLFDRAIPEQVGSKLDLADFLLNFPVPTEQPPEQVAPGPEHPPAKDLDEPLENWHFQDNEGRKVSHDVNDIQEAELAMTAQNPALSKLVDRLGLKADEVRTLNDEDLK